MRMIAASAGATVGDCLRLLMYSIHWYVSRQNQAETSVKLHNGYGSVSFAGQRGSKRDIRRRTLSGSVNH